MKNLKNIIIILLLTLAIQANAQVPVPASKQTKPVALTNGTAHLGNGQVIENAVITFDSGKLTNVADGKMIRMDMARYDVIDLKGQHVYPGLILPYTEVGLQEISAVRATRDYSETGSFNPHVRAIIAYNTDSEITPTFRSNGILLAQIASQNGILAGSSSIVQLDAWNWEDAIVREDDGIYLNWARMMNAPSRWNPTVKVEKNKNYEKFYTELGRNFKEAYAYYQTKPTKTNVKLEAMKGLFDGTKNLYLAVDQAKAIVEAINFAQYNHVKNIVLVGGRESWLVKDFIKENEIPVLLNTVHRLPSREEADVDMPFKLPGLLTKEGIPVGLYHSGMLANARNLPFLAGTAAAHGMDKEEALMLITSNTADIMGIADRVGTLEVGKDATLVVSEGDLLDMRTSKVTHAFIEGRKIDLNDKQKALYHKFKEKYDKQKTN